MTLFKNLTHQQVWIDRWCHTCYQPDEAMRRIQGKDTICPILNRALTSGRKPKEWDRTRNDEMEKSIRCNAFQDKPPRTVIKTLAGPVIDVPMFDVGAPVEHIRYVPVEGWPDRPTPDEVEHQ